MTSNQSVVIMEKPMQHLGLDDWNCRVTQLRNVADKRRQEAFDLRQDSRTLRNETRIEAEWNTYESNNALVDRVAELDRWRSAIERTTERINREFDMLKEEKAITEIEIELMVTPFNVVSECLAMRDCRLGSEITYDEADTELKKELAILENNQKLLREQCQMTWEKMNRLAEVRFKLNLEIDNKREAQDIDVAQLQIDKFAAGISFKPNATRIPRKAMAYEAWLEHSKNMKRLAENELADTYTIRESLFIAREKAKNVLKSQQDRTEHTIRKRIFETQKARNELEWQKLKLNDEMERAICEIKVLEQSLRDKTDGCKLAQTRLENRAQRAGKELVLDEPYFKLVDEVNKLDKIRKALQDQIVASKTNFTLLQEHAQRVNVDLDNKQHSLMTDIRGLDLRARLKASGALGPGADCKKKTQLDRNIELTQMEKEIPKA